MKKAMIAATALMLLVPGSVARGSDAKVVGGDWCVPEDSSETGFVYGGSVIHGQSGTDTVSCPVLRDNADNTTGLQEVTVQYNAPSGTTVQCTIYSASASGSVLDSATASGSDVGETSMTFGSSVITSSGNPGYYYLRCNLTGNGALVRDYRIEEY